MDIYIPQVSEQTPPSFPLLRVLGPAKVRGGGFAPFWGFPDSGLRKQGGGFLLECGSRAPGSWHRTPFFPARFARRIALFSYVFAAFGSRIPIFRRASRAGLLYFPMFLQLSGLKYRLFGALRAPDCLISLCFAASWPQIPIFRRASRAGLLHFPMVSLLSDTNVHPTPT